MPYFIKDKYPELIDRFNIPLDEYPRRCVNQIEKWGKMRQELVEKHDLTHERSKEYASRIMEAMETNVPYKFGGNVMNTGLIPNLPAEACGRGALHGGQVRRASRPTWEICRPSAPRSTARTSTCSS